MEMALAFVPGVLEFMVSGIRVSGVYAQGGVLRRCLEFKSCLMHLCRSGGFPKQGTLICTLNYYNPYKCDPQRYPSFWDPPPVINTCGDIFYVTSPPSPSDQLLLEPELSAHLPRPYLPLTSSPIHPARFCC